CFPTCRASPPDTTSHQGHEPAGQFRETCAGSGTIVLETSEGNIMRFQRIAASALVLALALVCSARAEGLKLGDPAPKLDVKEFIKGDPVPSLEKGKVYVVEFWAPWCPPCRTSIPHLTELQKKHKDAVFIGVSIAERNQAGVKPFVEQMG